VATPRKQGQFIGKIRRAYCPDAAAKVGEVTMRSSNLQIGWRRALCAAILLAAPALAALDRVAAAQEAFPSDEELLLDVAPMRGSKRVPMLDIRAGGEVTIDLWCNSVQGQLVVADNTITVLTGQKTTQTCAPEREQRDQELLSALEQVTTWRREGDGVVLIGPQKLRFRRATN
jgi:heat shock protein HslJ